MALQDDEKIAIAINRLATYLIEKEGAPAHGVDRRLADALRLSKEVVRIDNQKWLEPEPENGESE